MTSIKHIKKRRSIFSPVTEYKRNNYCNVFRVENDGCYDRNLRNKSEPRPISAPIQGPRPVSVAPIQGHVHGEECLKKSVIRIDNEPDKKVKEVSTEKPNKQVCFKNVAPRRMNWNNYHRLDVIHSLLDDLESDYPSICTTGIIGKSLEGRDLKIIKISNSDASNASVWIDAGIHAREWIAPAVNTYIADHIARNFNTLPSSITNKDWYFLPVVNPDGYEFSHTRDRMWRKNRAWHGGQCVGVDLNRNFSFGYGGAGSSDIPTNAFFRGPEAFSEPESCAVRVNTSFGGAADGVVHWFLWSNDVNYGITDMLLSPGVSFKVYITLHSYGQVILFPYAHTHKLCPDYIQLLEGATVMSKAIFDCNGNIYKVGISRDVMYANGAAGTSNDWSYGEAHIPFCYLIELRSKQHKFKLSKEEIQETANEILNCVKALMEFIDSIPPQKKKRPREI